MDNIKLLDFQFDSVKINEYGLVVGCEQKEAQHFIEELGDNKVSLEMVYIPEGEFMMGAPTTEHNSWNIERPQHKVKIPAFFMGKYPVTQAQYHTIVGEGEEPSHMTAEKLPIGNMSLESATKFCEKLSKTTGKMYRLPSEAEWEYACRSGTETPFHFGEALTSNIANYNNTYQSGITPVDKFKFANKFGLYDMHGNVLEWCKDVWHDTYNDAPNDGSAWLTGGEKLFGVLRGGSWSSSSTYCRSSFRICHLHQAFRISESFGLRLVCNV
jgi:formylglycine-generating enzyme required for sulfatase activity